MTTMLELQVRTQNYLADAARQLRENERGQTSIEYLGIIIAVGLLLAVIIGAASGFGTTITTRIGKVITDLG